MHNAAFAELAMDAVYLAFDTPPARLAPVMAMLAELGFGGLNLTVPLKETAFEILADLDDSARRLRSVNTVQFAAGRTRGYSTDGDGFLAALREEFDVTPAGRHVCILGCGGAGRAVAIACALAGAGGITLVNRTPARAERLAAELQTWMSGRGIHVVAGRGDAWRRACRAADIIVQSTSVGLRTDDPPLVDAAAFRPEQWFYDLIYHVPRTAMMAAAESAGARVCGGLGMLLHQGALAFEIWTGRPAPLDCMRRALCAAFARTVPGC